MKLTNLELVDSFLPSLNEIAKIRTKTSVALNISKTMQPAKSVASIFEQTRMNIIQSRCEIQNGKPKSDPNNPGYAIFENDKLKAEAIKMCNELADTEIELEIFPIKVSDIEDIEISANTLFGLKDFIQEN